MDVQFFNPKAEYMVESIIAFQSADEKPFWTEPLYRLYPRIDRSYAENLPFAERKRYMERCIRGIYAEMEDEINDKTERYARHWTACKPQITAALTDAFGVDCAEIFNDLRCNLNLNPIEPRYLTERRYDLCCLNSERGAIGESIHEMIHFVWFYVWNGVFRDGYDEYERPTLKWILSEMVVESIMRDERLSSINPYFPRADGGCIYPYFFDMRAGGELVLDVLDDLYRTHGMADFMKRSYAYCSAHEAEIRAHIRKAEGRI